MSTLDPRHSTRQPRHWNVWELERLARQAPGGEEAAEELTFLLRYLRDYADTAGLLPPEFDELVRESFAELLREAAVPPAPTPQPGPEPAALESEPESEPEREPVVAEPKLGAAAVAVAPRKRLGLTKKLLVLAMLIGLIAFVAGGSTFATFSAQTGNPGSSFGSGTLTLSDKVNSGTVCNSYGAGSNDNYNAACSAILALTNLAPGVIGGQAKLTIANTGSLDASLFSVFAPYVNGVLGTSVASGATVGAGQTVTGFTVSSLEGPVSTGDKIVLNAGTVMQQFCAGGNAAASAGSTTIPIAGGYPATAASTTLNGGIGSGAASLVVNAISGFPASGNFVIQIDNEQMLVTAGQGTTTWTVARGVNSTAAAAHSGNATVSLVTSGPCPALATTTAGTTFAAGTRVNDTSSNSTAASTDCWDAKTTSSSVAGATYGTQLNFNSVANNPFCSTALLYIEEQSTVGASTYNYCWFGRGSTFGDQSPGGEDSNGQCRTPTTMTLASNINASTGTTTALNGAITNAQTSITVTNGAAFGNGQAVIVDSEEMTISSGGGTNTWTVVRGAGGTTAAAHNTAAIVTLMTSSASLNAGTLAGNIRSGDSITLAENGDTMTCTAGGTYYINYNSATTPIALSGCSTTGGTTTFDSSAVVEDASAFTALNGSNSSSTLSNFDTAHSSSVPIYLPPLTGNGSANSGSSVQLAKSGGTGSVGDTRVFYIGVYFPAPAGSSQNSLQGLASTFGLGWHIDQ